MEHYPYLILGNSTGGIGAAEGIRAVDPESPIGIIGKEPGPVYARPLIADLLAGSRNEEEILYRPRDFYAERGIDLFSGVMVESVDCAGKTVYTGDGRRISWEKLLLAVGGIPIVPPIEGREMRGVFTFTTLEDARRIQEYLRHRGGGRQAVVLGGGLIGLKAAEALQERGIRVVMVELLDRILGPVLDPESSRMVEAAARSEGISLRLGDTIERIIPDRYDDHPLMAKLKSGSTVSADLVIMAIGVRPRAELARDAGLKAERGIEVNRKMETSHPGVYSCGDAAEIVDFSTGKKRPIPVWINAYWGGRVAGLNMAGEEREYTVGMMMNSLRVFGRPLVSAGVVNPPGEWGVEVLRAEESGCRRTLFLRGGRLIGYVLFGEAGSAGVLTALIRSGAEVEGLKDRMLNPGFSILDLPRSSREGIRKGRWNYSEGSAAHF